MKSDKIPSVAVITRTKNRTFLLERAIKSVMDQSFEDFVMVIVNDGGEPKDAEKLIEEHKDIIKSRVMVVHNKTSVGMENASNIAIKASSSKYIAMLDDDDTWDKNFLKETVSLLDSTDYKGVVTGSEIVKEVIEGQKIRTLSTSRFAPEINQIRLFDLSGVNQFPNNSFVYERSALSKVGHYDPEAPVLGDWEFNIRFLRYFDIAFIDKPLSHYHHRDASTGAMSNSLSSHAALNTYLLNKFLRNDLENNAIGLGVISNISSSNRNLKSEIDRTQSLIHELIASNAQIKAQIDHLNSQTAAMQGELREIRHGILSKLRQIIRKT